MFFVLYECEYAGVWGFVRFVMGLLCVIIWRGGWGDVVDLRCLSVVGVVGEVLCTDPSGGVCTECDVGAV